jgi:uncharacterized integral membrane protein
MGDVAVIGRLVSLLVGAVGAVVLIALALTNRHVVTLKLDPFNPDNPIISIPAPFYWFLFAAIILGIVLGGLATWFSQGKWRYTARKRTQEAARWRAEAERLTRERDENVTAAKQLVAANR